MAAPASVGRRIPLRRPDSSWCLWCFMAQAPASRSSGGRPRAARHWSSRTAGCRRSPAAPTTAKDAPLRPPRAWSCRRAPSSSARTPPTARTRRRSGCALTARMMPSVNGSQPLPFVRVGCVRADGQHGVQQQHALLRPRLKVPVTRRRRPDVVLELLEDIGERRRGRTSGRTESSARAPGPRPDTDPGRGSARGHPRAASDRAQRTRPPRTERCVRLPFLVEEPLQAGEGRSGDLAGEGGCPSLWNWRKHALSPTLM